MKKTLLALALPVMLLASCNKTVDNNVVPFKQFQRMARNTFTRGIMTVGTFNVIVNVYDVDPETGEIGEKDYERSESYFFIKNGDLIYYKTGGASSEYILDFENNTTLRKAGNSWIDQGYSPNMSDGYLCYAAQIGSSANQLTDNKNGKYNANGSFINYSYKRADGNGVFKYRCEYDLEIETFTNVRRYYYESTTHYYECEIKDITYEGVIPEH